MASRRTDKTHDPEPPHGPEAAASDVTRRIAGGTVVRAVGESVAKAASVVFYIAIARELGETTFGDFVFGLSLTGMLLTLAGFGTDELIGREVSRDHGRANRLFANTLALKLAMGSIAMIIVALVLVAGGYPADTKAAVLLIGVAVWIEVLSKTVQAVLLGHEAQQYIAGSLIVQRVSTAGVGIAVLLSGGGLIAVSLVMVGGAVLGFLSALFWLYRYVSRPRGDVDRSRWPELIRAGVPLGLVGVLFALLLKVDASLLSFLKGGDNTEVGQYGAAYRMIEATMFVSWAFGGAVLPWFSRHGSGGKVSLARGYELALKAIVAMLLPVAIGFGILAAPIIDLLYGDEFDGAVVPLQLLAAMTALYGVNALAAMLVISRDRPGLFARPAAIVIVQNIAFNFILIPAYGASGAAANAVISGVLLAVLTLRNATQIVGRVSLVRAFSAPVAAGLAFAGVLVATGAELSIPALIAASVAYVAAFLGVERVAFTEDFRLYADLVRRRRGPDEPPPGLVPDASDL